MLSNHGRALTTPLFTPVARVLLRLGLGPDAVSVMGTVGVVVIALWLLPQGGFIAGPLLIAAFALSDSVDGLMARQLEARGVPRSKDFGAFLDSTLDRVADAAIFAGLVLWYSGAGHSRINLILALTCLVLGSVVPYARARAEGLGMTASGGIAERADRLVAVLVAILAVGLGAPGLVMTVILAGLAVASGITIVQRMLTVRRQAIERLLNTLAADEAARAGGLATGDLAGVGAGLALPVPRRWTTSYIRRREPAEPWLVRRRTRRRRPIRPRSGR